MTLPLIGGPFDGRTHDAPPADTPLELTDDLGYRGTYRVALRPTGPALVFDPESSPAWATGRNPVVIPVDGRTFRVWPRMLNYEMRWHIGYDGKIDILAMCEVDVDTTFAEVEAMVRHWLAFPPFPVPRPRKRG